MPFPKFQVSEKVAALPTYLDSLYQLLKYYIFCAQIQLLNKETKKNKINGKALCKYELNIHIPPANSLSHDIPPHMNIFYDICLCC